MRNTNRRQQTAEETMARAARAEYMRKWRAANKDKVKKINQSYWVRRAEREQAAAVEQ